MKISEFQRLIERIYGEKDLARGTAGTFMWFAEEVGELARALKRGDRQNLEEEFADTMAWMTTLASIHGVELEEVVARKYGEGCPRCQATPCGCDEPVAPRPAPRRQGGGPDRATDSQTDSA